jgi:hypothetical protein
VVEVVEVVEVVLVEVVHRLPHIACAKTPTPITALNATHLSPSNLTPSQDPNASSA